MSTAAQLLLLAAIRGAADEIVGLWWTGPYAPGKVAAVESIIQKHLEQMPAETLAVEVDA